MEMHVAWDRNAKLVAKTKTGCEIPMAAGDATASSGKYPSAMEVFVAALGGCPAHEILTAMNEKEPVVTNLEVTIRGNRRATPPTIFDTLHVTFTLTGTVDDAYARGVIHDVMTRRCPVAVSFGRASNLTWDHRIVPAPER
jgi:uncharacterized OsmC-like protein